MAEETKVLLILAGGTICMKSSADGLVPTKGLLWTCLAQHRAFDDGSNPPADTIIDESGRTRPGDASFRLPSLDPSSPTIHYTTFEFDSLIDSSTADASYWNLIASCIAANYTSFDGFVILHGTDTLAWAASALSFQLHPLHKPVILTGSQVSIFDKPSDAWDNLHGSISIAGSTSPFPPPEVTIFFHRTLLRGNRSTKIHASEYAAFATPNVEPLATLTPTSRILYSNTHPPPPFSRPNPIPPLSPIRPMSSSTTSILRIYPGLSPSTLLALLTTPTIRGIILETFGAGNAPPTLLSTILATHPDILQDKVLVNVSQCLNGMVASIYAPARAMEKFGVVYGRDLTTEAAWTKLVWLLAGLDEEWEVGGGIARVRELMGVNLRGEMNGEKSVVDEIGEGLDQKRRNSLVVRGLEWREYVPIVGGLEG